LKQESNQWEVVQRVLVSAYLGIIIVGALVPIAGVARGGGLGGRTFVEVLQSIGSLMGSLIGFLVAALTFTLPLVACAVVAALSFDKSIRNHPGAWSIAAPVIVWIIASVMIALISWLDGLGSLVNGIWLIISSPFSLLLLLAATPSAAIFYVLSCRNARTGET